MIACGERNTPSSPYGNGNGGGNSGGENSTTVDFSYEEIGDRRIKLINKSSSDLTNFSWDFGDGQLTSEEKNPEHLYWKNGNYVVKLTAWGRNSQQKYVREKTITINSSIPSLESTIFIKGFKLYSIPSDGRYYKFSVVGSSWDESMNFTTNTSYTEKLYSSDLPRTFTLSNPKKIGQLIDLKVGYYTSMIVYVYQSTSTSQSGTQCLKQMFYNGEDYDDAGDEEFVYRDEYIVASDNGQTRIGVLMDWSDE